jgi:uncharacterized LabA/DUF88 family protein
MPPGPIYVYVDGESHYIRTESKAREVFGCGSLEEVRPMTGLGSGPAFFTAREDCSFVWDSGYCDHLYPSRKYYFTAFSGDEKVAHDIKAFLRGSNRGFDPEIIKEDKGKRKNRMAQTEELKLIEKPKGCDIALAVRMFEDAANDNFNTACLFTSDADFLPLIRAVRRMGKYVILFGYKENLGNPELAYVADEFIDLAGYIHKNRYELKPSGESKTHQS